MTFSRLIVITVSLALVAACGGDSDGDGGDGPGALTNNYSLRFDGEDDYGSAGAIDISLDEVIEAFSVSLWFKADGEPQAEATMMQLNPELESGADSMQVTLSWPSPNEIRFRVTPNASDGPAAQVTTTVDQPQSWNHFLATFDATAESGNVRVYLNGEEVGARDLTEPLNTVGNVQFGRRGFGVAHFAGLLDEAALWASALDEGEIGSVYNEGRPRNVAEDYGDYASSMTLRSLWRMGDENVGDEGNVSADNVSDFISGNNCTVVGGGTFETDTP